MRGKSYELKTPEYFIYAYADSNFQDRNLLCELYQHDLILATDRLWNPNPMVGDLKLRAFVSYIHHQTQWGVDQSTFSNNKSCSLWIRGEHNPYNMVTWGQLGWKYKPLYELEDDVDWWTSVIQTAGYIRKG